MRYILCLILLLSTASANADNNIAIGQWRSHQNFSHSLKVAQLGDTIYCATYAGMYYYIRSTGVMTPLSKINGFNDVSINAMGCSKKYHDIFLGYQSSNIDILHNGKILNMSDISTFNRIAGAKSINGFFFNDKFCYIATSFGIVQYDIERNEVFDDYQEIWPTNANSVPVNSIAFFNDSIYAATPLGLIGAPLNNNVDLRDYTQWKLIINNVDCKALQVFNNKLWLGINSPQNSLRYFDKTKWNVYSVDTSLHKVSSIEANTSNILLVCGGSHMLQIDTLMMGTTRTETGPDAIMDEFSDIWIANAFYGLIEKDTKDQLHFLKPNGPTSASNACIYSANDIVYVAHGGYDIIHYSALYDQDGVSIFSNGIWTPQNKNAGTPWFGNFQDVNSVVTDPVTGYAYYGSFGYGVAVYNNGKLVDTLGATNSPFRSPLGFDTVPYSRMTGDIRIGGMAYDDNGTLWIANFLAKTPLIAKRGNKYSRYDVTSNQGKKDIITVTPDDNGQIWMRRGFTGGIMVMDVATTLTYDIGTSVGSGNLPDIGVNCLVKDKQGEIWAGTNNGVTVFANTQGSIVKGSWHIADATPPWVENGKESGYLLSLQQINCIAIDGADRKWIGTKNGLFVTSEDGTQILYNFTTKNSPLPSNNIQNIGINGVSGEIFIGTDAGIMSYRANATEAADDLGEVVAFPNPVRPGYTGPIAIKGLTDNSSVKITDVTGNIVWETTSHGGLVTWDGRNFSGRLANSGVYLILMVNSDGSQSHISKLLIVR